jgi:hypothetical protein
MQEVVLDVAHNAGAEIWRGAAVRGIRPCQNASLCRTQAGRENVAWDFNDPAVFYETIDRIRRRRGQIGQPVPLQGVVRTHDASFCIGPVDADLPRDDRVLTQKWLLETDEEKFLKIANRLYGLRC